MQSPCLNKAGIPEFTLIGLFVFSYRLRKKKKIQQYQQLSLNLWEDSLPHRFLQLRALTPSYWNLLSVVVFLFFVIKWVSFRRWGLGVRAALFVAIRDGDGGKGTGTKTVGNPDWKILKYLKSQICFSVSLIWLTFNFQSL